MRRVRIARSDPEHPRNSRAAYRVPRVGHDPTCHQALIVSWEQFFCASSMIRAISARNHSTSFTMTMPSDLAYLIRVKRIGPFTSQCPAIPFGFFMGTPIRNPLESATPGRASFRSSSGSRVCFSQFTGRVKCSRHFAVYGGIRSGPVSFLLTTAWIRIPID